MKANHPKSGEEEYREVCEFCGKMFKRKQVLKCHKEEKHL